MVTSITRVTNEVGAQLGALEAVTAGISPDGTRVVLQLSQPHSVSDANGVTDVYVKDLVGGALTLVSANPAGNAVGGSFSLYGEWISRDNNLVVFTTTAALDGVNDLNAANDIYVKKLSDGSVQRVSADAAGASVAGAVSNQNIYISLDGATVTFSTTQALVGADTNGVEDIYRKTLATGAVERLSTTSLGGQIPGGASLQAISRDGTKIAFISTDTTLVANDTNGNGDLFVKDLTSGAVTRINVDQAGAQTASAIGPTAAFSPDGTKLAFLYFGALIPSDTNNAFDVYVRTLTAGPSAIVRATTTAAGGDLGILNNQKAFFTPDGTKLVFNVGGSGVPADTNGGADTYIKTLATGELELASTNPAGVNGDGPSSNPHVAAEANRILFFSAASNLVTPDTNGGFDWLVVTPGVAATPAASNPTSAPPPTVAPTVATNFVSILGNPGFGPGAAPQTVTTPTGQVLPNPLLEQQKAVAALIAKVDAGAMTLRQAQDIIVDMADATTSVATMNYQFFTGHLPSREGLGYIVASSQNPTDLNDGYYAGMSPENRYINMAVNLGKVGEGRAGFTASYGGLSLSDATAKAYLEIFGKSADAAKLAAILTPERQSYFLSMGGDALGQKAAMVGFLLGEAAKADLGPYAARNENFLYDLLDGVAAFGADAHVYDYAGPIAVGLVGIA